MDNIVKIDHTKNNNGAVIDLADFLRIIMIQMPQEVRLFIFIILFREITCKSAVRPPLNTQGSWSPLMKLSFHPLENPEATKSAIYSTNNFFLELIQVLEIKVLHFSIY